MVLRPGLLFTTLNIIHFKLTRRVLWKLDSTCPNISLPTIVAMVGNTRAPQRIRVTEIGSDNGAVYAGMRYCPVWSTITRLSHKFKVQCLLNQMVSNRWILSLYWYRMVYNNTICFRICFAGNFRKVLTCLKNFLNLIIYCFWSNILQLYYANYCLDFFFQCISNIVIISIPQSNRCLLWPIELIKWSI